MSTRPIAVKAFNPPSTRPSKMTPNGRPEGSSAPAITHTRSTAAKTMPARPSRVSAICRINGARRSLAEAVELGVGGPVGSWVVAAREVLAAFARDPRPLLPVEVCWAVRVPVGEGTVDRRIEGLRPAGPRAELTEPRARHPEDALLEGDGVEVRAGVLENREEVEDILVGQV